MRDQPHKEVVDAPTSGLALSIAYTRGMSSRSPARVAEIDQAGNELTVEEIPASSSDGAPSDYALSPLNSKLVTNPITTIAWGVFLGLLLFLMFTLLLSTVLGGGISIGF